MRELQGTRSRSRQGCYRARQRLHGLLRGVAVNAALVWAASGRGGGSGGVGVGVGVGAEVVLAGSRSDLVPSGSCAPCSVLLTTARRRRTTTPRASKELSAPCEGANSLAAPVALQCVILAAVKCPTVRRLRMRQERAASISLVLPVV